MRLIAIACAVLVAACSPTLGQPVARPTPAQSTSSPSPSAEVAPTAIAAFVPVAESFVEAHRGLTFKSHVKVTFLGDGEFQARLASTESIDAAAFVVEAKVLHALGLLEGLPDLAKAERALQGASVVGYYDPKTKELVVRGVDATPTVRQVLVHELTHALQDQWFGIDRTAHNDDESDLAFRTLVEGDAVRIQNEYIASLSADEKRQVQAGEASGPGPPADVPQVLLELESFPYIVGPRFTTSVVSVSQDRLDAAFRSPPATTAEVIHPERFLAGQVAAAVDFPPAGGGVIDKGVIGELGLDLLMGRLASRGQLPRREAQTIGAAWNGDRYVAWDEGGATCVRTNFVMATPEATDALIGALRKFAALQSRTTIAGRSPVVFTACA